MLLGQPWVGAFIGLFAWPAHDLINELDPSSPFAGKPEVIERKKGVIYVD